MGGVICMGNRRQKSEGNPVKRRWFGGGFEKTAGNQASQGASKDRIDHETTFWSSANGN